MILNGVWGPGLRLIAHCWGICVSDGSKVVVVVVDNPL